MRSLNQVQPKRYLKIVNSKLKLICLLTEGCEILAKWGEFKFAR